MRNDWLISVCACTVPVSATVLPAARCSMVMARTGRISGAGGSTLRWQADSSASQASVAARALREDRPHRRPKAFTDTGKLPGKVIRQMAAAHARSAPLRKQPQAAKVAKAPIMAADTTNNASSNGQTKRRYLS